MLSSIEKAFNTLELAAVIDHSGRGGNAFFLTTFDHHTEVLTCPLMHYTYSYIVSTFGMSKNIDVNVAKDFLVNKSYFRLLCSPDALENKELIYRMGAHNITVPSDKILSLTEKFFSSRQHITRKELVLLPFIIYAIASDFSIDRFKYVLVSDAVSLRDENVTDGFSGKVIDEMLLDFPEAKMISMVRDPRATFASPRHQFVNQLGNMYAVTPYNYFSRLFNLLRGRLTADNGCVYLYWLLYLAQSTHVIRRLRKKYKDNFMIVKNEDLNLEFKKTTDKICSWLGVEPKKAWMSGDFTPTILGKPWMGTGAYNSRYQTQTKGMLQNDSKETSLKIAGPNAYVTQRWQSKLNQREIKLLEYLFSDEINVMGYKPLYPAERSAWLVYMKAALMPFEGEWPNFKWLFEGFKMSMRDGGLRLFYTGSFMPFYILSRLKLYQFMFHSKIFLNQELDCQTSKREVGLS